MGSSIAWFSTKVRRTARLARVSRISVSYDYCESNDATSNDSILYPSGTFCFWMYLTNSLVFLIVNSDLLNGANKLAKYFAVLYVAVPMLDTVGLNVKSSTLLVESLYYFCIPIEFARVRSCWVKFFINFFR